MSVLEARREVRATVSVGANDDTRADAQLEPSVATYITRIATSGNLPPQPSVHWSYQKWKLYLTLITRSAPAPFYMMVRERCSRNHFNHSELHQLFLLACIEALAVSIDSIADDLRIFLSRADQPDGRIALYRALCERGYAEMAIDLFKAAQGVYAPAASEEIEALFADFVPEPLIV